MNRYRDNPIITRDHIPASDVALKDVSSVFNPGGICFEEKILLLLRVQNRGRETFIMKAVSSDGKKFIVEPEPVNFSGIENVNEKIYHLYDPRISKVDEDYIIMFAMDFDNCCRLGIAKTSDFNSYYFIGITSGNDTRNGVLFPEKIDNHFVRLERPNTMIGKGGVKTGNSIILSVSENLVDWKGSEIVFEGRSHFWDEYIGPGTPPVKTKEGWLFLYHGVATHFAGSNIYQAGAALLDLTDPSKLAARTRYNILEPRESYELTGQVPNVVFPTAMIVKRIDRNGFAEPDSEVLIYYGAADTSVCLATVTVSELIRKCYEE
ncbi:MAG: glycoside hydrolase family 130 protein [Ignavibacteriaceae bacterium]